VDGIYRIEHFESFSKKTALRISSEKGAVCVQPNFMDIWGRSGGLYSMALGNIFRTLNRFGDIERDGIPFSFGTDMMPPGPISSMKGCLNHPDPIQNLTLENSIKGFTNFSRFHSFLQGTIGHGDIASGKRADLVLLDRKFKKVQATIRKGKVIFSDTNFIT
jgi:predicted amidohydrolase YtcJ